MNETKRRILEKSKELFKSKGFKATTLNDICKASEISKHTFYYYFEGKEALFENLVFPNDDELQATVLSEIALKTSAFEKYMTINNYVVNKYIEFGPEIASELFIYKLSGSLLKKGHGPFNDIVVALIDQAKASGEINRDEPTKQLLRYTGAMMMGMTLVWARRNGDFDLKKEIIASTCILLNVNKDMIDFDNLG